MREVPEVDTCETELARDMLAAGVIISEFEARFEREGGLVSSDFHKEWEVVIARWWELAARHEDLAASRGELEQSVAHSASLARMFKPPHGFVL